MKNINLEFLKQELLKCHVEYFECIDSTNKCLKQDEYIDNTLLIADEQSNGVGRINRKFVSNKSKGIYMSLKIKPSFDLKYINKLTPSVGVVIADAIYNQVNIYPEIKWVNDIYLNNLKIAGILVESVIKNNAIEYLIIGIGINCYNQDLLDLNSIASSIEKETNIVVDRNKLIVDIIKGIYNLFDNFDDNYYLSKYRKFQYLKNKQLTVSTINGEYQGTYFDIDNLGGLIITSNNELKTFYNGEVIKTRINETK